MGTPYYTRVDYLMALFTERYTSRRQEGSSSRKRTGVARAPRGARFEKSGATQRAREKRARDLSTAGLKLSNQRSGVLMHFCVVLHAFNVPESRISSVSDFPRNVTERRNRTDATC